MSDGFDKTAYQKEYMNSYRQTHRRVEIQLPQNEYNEFKKLADREGVSVNTCIKNMAIAYRQGDTLVPESIEKKLSETSLLIRNIANNVNQVAHRSNTLKVMVDEHDLLMELKRLDDAVKDYTHNKVRKEPW